MIQEPIVMIDYIGDLLNGQLIITDGVPLVGLYMVSGMIYSTQNIILSFDQGVNDKTGALLFRLSDITNILAGVARGIDFPINSKFGRIIIANLSGANTTIEVFFSARAYE